MTVLAPQTHQTFGPQGRLNPGGAAHVRQSNETHSVFNMETTK